MNSNNSTVPDTSNGRNGPPIAGWYGKIPCLGDFVSRRLPADFIVGWDLWLQHAIAASRAQLGERWLDLYLIAPIWRFILMPGVCGTTPGILAGVLMPSVDNVGRYFPLTIALRMDSRPGTILSVFSAQPWYSALERIAVSTLNINSLPDDLDRKLANHPFPAVEPGSQRVGAQELAAWWQAAGNPATLMLPTENALADLCDATAEDLLSASALGKSFWWTVLPEARLTQLHCFTGLPPENYFASMLQVDSPNRDDASILV
ncbi:MAG: type VI secretion system-associated protein TagF [Nitrosospira sp.]